MKTIRMGTPPRKRSSQVGLSREHVRRMEKGAAAALARRGGGFLFEQALGTLELLLVTGLSLAALWLWGASALGMLVVLLATAWLGIFAEMAKYLLLRRAVRAEVAVMNEDAAVWHVVTAMMLDRKTVSRDALQGYQPGVAMVVDLVGGSIGTLGILAAVYHAGGDPWQAVAGDPPVLWTLAAIAGWQVLSLAWLTWRHRAGADAGPPRFQAGARGFGLFLLGFLVMAAGDEGRDLRSALSWTYGLLLLLVPLAVFGLVLIRRETRWLAAYMRDRETAQPG